MYYKTVIGRNAHYYTLSPGLGAVYKNAPPENAALFDGPLSRCTRCWTYAATSPAFIRITEGKVHDVNILDEIMPEAGAFYVMDRAYVDFERLFFLTLSLRSVPPSS